MVKINSSTNSHQKETDMKEFEVELYRMTHYSQYGTFVIKAESEADAQKKIDDLIYNDALPNDNYYDDTNDTVGAWDLEPDYPGDEEISEDWEIQVINEKEK